MLQYSFEMEVNTTGRRLIDITAQLKNFVRDSRIKLGFLNISILHTSASLLIQENASRDVLVDLLNFYDKLVPMGKTLYNHSMEGEDDMPAHIKTSLTNTNLTLSVVDGIIKLGVWQGIFLFEHRVENHLRIILCHVMGEN